MTTVTLDNGHFGSLSIWSKLMLSSGFHINKVFDDFGFKSYTYVQLICHTRVEPTVFECTYDIFDQFHSQGPL